MSAPMRIRITKVDEYQFLTCVKHSVWGSNSARFKNWNIDDYLVFTVDQAVAGLSQVSSELFVSDKILWDIGQFPYRISIRFTHVFHPLHRLAIFGQVRDALISAWGLSYGWGIRNQQALDGIPAETIIKAVESQYNDLSQIQATIDQLLHQAKPRR